MGRPKDYWISDPAQIEASANAVRTEINDLLVAAGPMNVREIAHNLGRNVTAVYHHLKLLEKVGLIESLPQESSPRGRPHVVYRTVGKRLRMRRAAENEALRPLVAKCAKVVAAQAGKDYVAGLNHPEARFDGPKQNLLFGRAVLRASPEKIARINAQLTELTELALEPSDEEGLLVSVAWFFSPLDRPLPPARSAVPGRAKSKKARSPRRRP